MNSLAELVRGAIRQAIKPGEALAPTDLLTLIEQDQNPLQRLSDADQCNSIFQVIDRQFAFDFVRAANRIPTDEEIDQWVLVIRWIFNSYNEWSIQADPKLHKLTALFVTVDYCDFQNTFWKEFSTIVPVNNEVIHTLKRVLEAYRCNLYPDKNLQPSIWEQEAIERFIQADAAGNWIVIDELWRSIAANLRQNLFIRQAVNVLYCYDLNGLITASNYIHQILVATQIISALDYQQRIHLACESNNHYLYFACAYITFRNSERLAVSTVTNNLLVKLLSKVVPYETQWKCWMQVFNRYPSRYEIMQSALGMTLSNASMEAISIYINSIILNKTDSSRNAATKCLRTFCSHATPELRKMLWKIAYERWKEWAFGLNQNRETMSEIAHSAIDYAVVAYLAECLTTKELSDAIINLENNFLALDKSWFDSGLSYRTTYYKILSELQLYRHASKCKTEELSDYLPSSIPSVGLDQSHDYYSIKLSAV